MYNECVSSSFQESAWPAGLGTEYEASIGSNAVAHPAFGQRVVDWGEQAMHLSTGSGPQLDHELVFSDLDFEEPVYRGYGLCQSFGGMSFHGEVEVEEAAWRGIDFQACSGDVPQHKSSAMSDADWVAQYPPLLARQTAFARHV